MVNSSSRVLVLGGTGYVGFKVVKALINNNASNVFVLSRSATNAKLTTGDRCEIIQGNVMVPDSIKNALESIDVLMYCINVTNESGASVLMLQTITQNVISAVKNSPNLKRVVVFNMLQLEMFEGGIFQTLCEFEKELAKTHVAVISVRPGSFLDQGEKIGTGVGEDAVAANTLENKYMDIFHDGVSAAFTYCNDFADSAAKLCISEKDIQGYEVVDIGWSDGPKTPQEMSQLIAKVTNRKIVLSGLPGCCAPCLGCCFGCCLFPFAFLKDFVPVVRSGKYICNNKRHEELVGPTPSAEDAIRRWATEKGLLL